MIRKIALLILLLGVAFYAEAQPYGNEWIVQGQSYVKVPVAQTGIVRVYKDTLDKVGFNLGSVNPKRIQIFRRGVEITRYIPNENSAIFGSGSYLEFYASRNDGRHDGSEYYKKPEYQPNPYYNLHNDTAAYFITFSNDPLVNGKSMPLLGSYDANAANTTSMTRDEVQYFNSDYSLGKGYLELDSRIHHSYFDLGEGFTSSLSNQPTNFTISNLPAPNANAFYATLEVCVSGRNGRDHISRISVGNDQNATLSVDTLIFTGYGFQKSIKQIPMSLIRNGNLVVKITPLGNNGSTPDYVSATYFKVSYTRTLDLSNASQPQEYHIAPASGTTVLQAVFANANTTARFYDITDEENVSLLNSLPLGFSQIAINKNGVGQNGIDLFYAPTVYAPSSLQVQRVDFRFNGLATANYLMIYNRQLILPAGSFQNPVKAYTDYRASSAGGRFDTLSLDIRQVYNQFNYGDYGPIAIRRLVDYLLDRGRLQYVNLLGKAITTLYRGGPQDLVPSWGTPSSDILIVADLNGSGVMPAVPIGRISAQRSSDLAAYLSKLIEYEATGFTNEWRKRSLFLSGGRTSSELSAFRDFINKYGDVASGPLHGASAKKLSKASNNIIEFINITDQINAGVQQITIFGHSSNSGADVDIGRPSDPGVDNRGKYPLIMINGCRGGNMYEPTGSLNEDWVLTPNKGSIAFMASVDEAFPTLLDQYVSRFFKYQWTDTSYFAKPIGLVQKKLIQDYALNFNSTYDSILCDQFTLHGDPALIIFNAKKADYVLNASQVFFPDANINATAPSFRIGMRVLNLAKAPNDSLVIGITRTLPNGTQRVIGPFKVRPVMFRDTFYFDIPRAAQNAAGLNVFEVKLNYYDSIAEIDYSNNIARVEIYLKQSSVQALFPVKYSIVSSTSVTLVAQATDINTPERNYYFEVDTSNQFNSPIKQFRNVLGSNLVQQTVTLPLQLNNTIWFWRVKFADNINPGDTAYDRGSFTYINGSQNGWNQGSFVQMNEAVVQVMQRDFVNRRYFLPNLSVTLAVKTSGSSINDADIVYQGLSIINGSGNNCASTNRTLSIVLDQYTLSPKVAVYTGNVTKPWQYSCGREPVSINFYNDDAVSAQLSSPGNGGSGANFSSVLDGDAYMGDYIMFMSYNRISYNNFTFRTRKLFAKIGADTSKMALLEPGDPFIIIGKKGAAEGSALQVYPNRNSATPPSQQTLNLATTLVGQPFLGNITSTKIGPASSWSKVFYKFDKLDPSDSIFVTLYASKLNGIDSLVYSGFSSGLDISSLDAKRFPYLYLKADLIDLVNRTPGQLSFWRVLYSGVPEGIVTTAIVGATTNINAVEEGAFVNLKFGFKNISPIAFTDSLVVQCKMTNLNSGRIQTILRKIPALAAGVTDSIRFTNINTEGFAGDNRIDVNVNPKIQSELYYNNNILQYSVKVNADKAQPTLDVVFDGVRIMDGDIVNPSPFISISMRDNNQFKIKRDTVGLTILLTPPGINVVTQRVAFNDSRIQWFAATASSPFRIEFRPGKLEDGKYKLQVSGLDASGNTSGGGLAYSISFSVINESRMSHFYPYPNPFSTSTRFVFTLTGDKVPDELKIQIMTVSGRVVREITRGELGPIRIGNNISSFAWDGSDEYGDKLANGVYLYKVVARTQGANMELFNTAADDTFKYGFGKMYIMR